jgi:prophage antirepressor-like protein
MKEIQIFNHKMFGAIRTTTNEQGEPLFVGKDVAEALGYAKPQNALATHVDKEDKSTAPIQGTAYETRAIFINESGLYSLVLSSKLPQARAFKRWVTSEVLPQIRRTSGYIPTKDSEGRQLSDEEIVERALLILGHTLKGLNAPSNDCLTATEVAKNWGMDVTSFNLLLSHMGIQHRSNGRWYLDEELLGQHLTEDRHFLGFSLRGKPKLKSYLTWTPKGVRYLNRRFLASESEKPKVIQLSFLVD